MSIKVETTELDKLLSSEEFEHLNAFINPQNQDTEELLEITETPIEEE